MAKKIAAIEQEMIEHSEDARSRIFRLAHDEYEAWSDEQYRSRPKYCDDIPSGEVTQMVQEGLVLLGNPAEDVAEGPEEPVEREEEDEDIGPEDGEEPFNNDMNVLDQEGYRPL